MGTPDGIKGAVEGFDLEQKVVDAAVDLIENGIAVGSCNEYCPANVTAMDKEKVNVLWEAVDNLKDSSAGF